MGWLNGQYFPTPTCGRQVARGRSFQSGFSPEPGRLGLILAVVPLLFAPAFDGTQASTTSTAAAQRGLGPTVRVNPRDSLNYVWIPPGTFTMGCSPGDDNCKVDEKPPHRVTISAGFWLGQIQVPVKAYQNYAAERGRKAVFNDLDLNLPVGAFDVSWYDAWDYCGWAGGRLPTEAEWEYAARGGTTQSRYGENLDDIAWYLENGNRKEHEGGLKKPNPFGLFDMLGNLWEWVNDWYDPNYYQHSPDQDRRGRVPARHGCCEVGHGAMMRLYCEYPIGASTARFPMPSDSVAFGKLLPRNESLNHSPDVAMHFGECRPHGLSCGEGRENGVAAVGSHWQAYHSDASVGRPASGLVDGESGEAA